MAHRRAEKGSSEDGFCRLNISFQKEKGWKGSVGKGTVCVKSPRHRRRCTGSPELVAMPSLSWRAGDTYNPFRPDLSRCLCCSRLSRQVATQSMLCCCCVKTPARLRDGVRAPQSRPFQEPLGAQDSSSLSGQGTYCWAPPGDSGLGEDKQRGQWSSRGCCPQPTTQGQLLPCLSPSSEVPREQRTKSEQCSCSCVYLESVLILQLLALCSNFNDKKPQAISHSSFPIFLGYLPIMLMAQGRGGCLLLA